MFRPFMSSLRRFPSAHGGFGAKGIGELPHDGPAPAILNAIRDATGIGFHSIPLLPEDLFAEFAAREALVGAGSRYERSSGLPFSSR